MTKAKEKPKRRLKANIRRFSKQSVLIFVTVVVTVLIALYFAALILLRGPSPTFSHLVVNTMMETRRGKAVAHWFFSEEEIAAIQEKNTVGYTTDITTNVDEDFVIPDNEKDDIQVYDVSGSTFKGKMMVIRDPSRIQLAVNLTIPGDEDSGFLVEDVVQQLGAVGGINGGGFEDPNWQSNGAIPWQVVIQHGELITGQLSDWVALIGFTNNNHLLVGNMTAEDALSWGMRDAVTFGPVLIVNGSAVPVTGTGGGLNPRTCIGQTADGSVLLLVIDGRQTTSLGASYEDCINVLLEYGAINAANLDGGSSSVMVYDGAIINSVVSMYGERHVPTAWIVQ